MGMRGLNGGYAALPWFFSANPPFAPDGAD